MKQYLVAHGVTAARLTAQGYGETQPLDPRHTPEAWAQNRRVDFLILRRAGGRAEAAAPPPSNSPPSSPSPPPSPAAPPPPPRAVTGELAAIHDALAARDLESALRPARATGTRASPATCSP